MNPENIDSGITLTERTKIFNSALDDERHNMYYNLGKYCTKLIRVCFINLLPDGTR